MPEVDPSRAPQAVPVSVEPGRFPIIDVPHDAPEEVERAGTTVKFWLHERQLLFKQARERTGEDWSEKITSELAAEMGLPAVYVELAAWKGNAGIVTGSFLQPGEEFIEAQELRRRTEEKGTSHIKFEPSPLTLRSLFELLAVIQQPLRWPPPNELLTTAETFIGYLVFDAWVCNEDRHDRNWGVIDVTCGSGSPHCYHLAPTFDHASSLGREFSDEQRTVMLSTGQVVDYVARCPSGVHPDAADTAGRAPAPDVKPMPVHELLRAIAKIHPGALRSWLSRLLDIPVAHVERLYNRLPSNSISPLSRTFALELMTVNRQRLEQLYSER